MEFDHILKLIDAVSDSSLTGFELDDGTFKLTFEAQRQKNKDKDEDNTSLEKLNEDLIYTEKNETQIEEQKNQKIVKSPLVGVFYAAPGPDASPYIQVGQSVEKNQVLGIVEAMKLMNEIESEYEGKIAKILVEDGQMVEYDQPMFVIES